MKRSKKWAVGLALAAALVLLLLVGSGFVQRTDVVLTGYEVSADGRTLTLDVSLPTSMGYVRAYRDEGGGVRPHYLHFYSTFGGLNSSFGAQSRFTLPLGEQDDAVLFYRGGGGYALVLEKDEATGQWTIPEPEAP